VNARNLDEVSEHNIKTKLNEMRCAIVLLYSIASGEDKMTGYFENGYIPSGP
jgi:hypothetical protein